MKFDRRLNFGAQIENVKAKVADRLNLMKILFYDPSWRLPEHTLIQLYKSLIRSIIEYSSFLVNNISKSYLKTLEAIQNNTLRIIFRITWEEAPTLELRERAKVCKIEDRLKDLNKKYLKKALLTSNPLITNLIDDYLTFRRNNDPNNTDTKTALCHIIPFNQLQSQPNTNNLQNQLPNI